MNNKFLENSTLITYSPAHITNVRCDNLENLIFDPKSDEVYWLNTYGFNELSDIKKVVIQNNLDDFLIKLFQEKGHVNKVIELDNVLFIAIKVLITEGNKLKSEQMIFVVSSNMLWSLQKDKGSYFEWIRERLTQGKGLLRSKKVDYLMFLIIESMVSSYESTFENIINNGDEFLNISNIRPTPYFTEEVEQQKMRLLNFKKATLSLRNTIVKLQTINNLDIQTKYFIELKEQANNLISEIDFELSNLDSKINLIFSFQGHRLNEIMRMLTIISVVFIPLTFIAGVYGMNFEYMPELRWRYGYFIVLSGMAATALFIVFYFRKKRWI